MSAKLHRRVRLLRRVLSDPWLAGSQTWTRLADGPVADVGTVSVATAATLMVDRASDPFAPSGTAFRCVVTNACGSETSHEATLTVTNCDADLNCDGLVNSQDFYDFLIAFFELRADINRDGVTNSQDLFDLLEPFLKVPPPGC